MNSISSFIVSFSFFFFRLIALFPLFIFISLILSFFLHFYFLLSFTHSFIFLPLRLCLFICYLSFFLLYLHFYLLFSFSQIHFSFFLSGFSFFFLFSIHSFVDSFFYIFTFLHFFLSFSISFIFYFYFVVLSFSDHSIDNWQWQVDSSLLDQVIIGAARLYVALWCGVICVHLSLRVNFLNIYVETSYLKAKILANHLCISPSDLLSLSAKLMFFFSFIVFSNVRIFILLLNLDVYDSALLILFSFLSFFFLFFAFFLSSPPFVLHHRGPFSPPTQKDNFFFRAFG